MATLSEKSNIEKANPPSNKSQLRAHFKQVRRDLPEVRRREASEMLWEYLQGSLTNRKKVLSFASMKDEIDLSSINKILQDEKRLHLPKIEKDHIVAYQVTDVEKETYYIKHHILQPNPEFCRKEEAFDCILVPAIAFDERLYRLGYGFGFYDRLLAKYPNTHTIGIGFREQLSLTPLPREEHDQPVKELCLV